MTGSSFGGVCFGGWEVINTSDYLTASGNIILPTDAQGLLVEGLE